MKLSTRGSSAIARSRLSKALVILQVAMSLVLLIGAGLFLRTLRNLEHVDLGFNQENLLLFTLKPEAVGYKDEKLVQFYQQLFARLDALPGAFCELCECSIDCSLHEQHFIDSARRDGGAGD